jgi:hypothetical protein
MPDKGLIPLPSPKLMVHRQLEIATSTSFEIWSKGQPMLPLGHVAYTWAALTWLQSNGLAQGVDYRGTTAAALLPDLIDKPLSLTLLANSGTSQGLSHTLLGHAALTLAVARFKPGWLPYALIANSHLIADQMWKYPRTLFFPFSGRLDSWKFMGTPEAMLSAYAEIATRPSILLVEALGLVLLGWTARRGQLNRRVSLKRLLLTGKLSVPDHQGNTANGEKATAKCE